MAAGEVLPPGPAPPLAPWRFPIAALGAAACRALGRFMVQRSSVGKAQGVGVGKDEAMGEES